MNQKASLITKTVILLMTTFLVSCDSSRIYDHNVSVNKGWHWDDARQFEVNISDTISAYNLFVNMRHDQAYRYANCWLSIKTYFPSGDSSTSRLEFKLAEPDGSWTGECTGNLCFRRELIGDYRKFPEKGKYVFELKQDMREEWLSNVWDVGIRIEKVSTPL